MKRLLVGVTLIALIGCDQTDPASPTMDAQLPALALNTSSEFFFFMPPIGPGPAGNGLPNIRLAPEMFICALTSANETATCDETTPLVREFASSEIAVDTDHYQAEWDTGAQDPTLSGPYRLHVVLGTVLVGTRDLFARTSTSGSAPAGFFDFNSGSNVPIKFRIDRGILCGGLVDCVEGLFDSNGVLTPEGKASLLAQTDPVDPITVVVHRIPIGPNGVRTRCIEELDMPQIADEFTGCYKVDVKSDDTGPLPTPGTMSLCIDEGLIPAGVLTHSQQDGMPLFRQSDDKSQLQALPIVPAELLACENILAQRMELQPQRELRFAARLWNGVKGILGEGADLFRPQELLAAALLHTGRGGLLGELSLFVVSQTGTYQADNTETQIGEVNTSVAIAPSATLVDPTGAPVVGALVHFSVTDGGGILDPAVDANGETIVETGTDGVASLTDWTLGPNDGVNTVLVTVSGAEPADGNPVTFSALGCTPGSAFGQATIDGVVDTDTEWACASDRHFAANLSKGSATPAVVRWMRDDTYLYLSLQVERSAEDKVNRLRFDLDDDEDGASPNDAVIIVDPTLSGDNKLIDGFLTRRCVGSKQASCFGSDDVQHGDARFVNEGTYSTYELRVPLASGDGQDIDLTGFALRGYLTLALGNGAQGNTQEPGFQDYSWVLFD